MVEEGLRGKCVYVEAGPEFSMFGCNAKSRRHGFSRAEICVLLDFCTSGFSWEVE